MKGGSVGDRAGRGHGGSTFVHAGAVAAIADSAAGYAALSLMPPGAGVLTTEFKINLVTPAGERIVARGRVVKAGRTLTLAQTEVFAEAGGEERLVALLTATLMTVEGHDGWRINWRIDRRPVSLVKWCKLRTPRRQNPTGAAKIPHATL
ncbi:MAG: hypothetical protein BroJett029_17910 [Alphaproteobacteria bacterium]|nr:MAG: hypothetical protein BroJett029_17910 [Alphaproteobacteria bacterium]